MFETAITDSDARIALEPMCGCGLLGALKCIAGIDGILPMIHGPVSCSSGHRLAMLYAQVEPLLPTTCIEQTQVVLGSTAWLADAMQKAWDAYHPRLLLVLLTCATAMTGENFAPVVEKYQQNTGALALVLDGSALAGDEVDICPRLYAQLCELLKISPGSGRALAPEGFAKTDYGFAENAPALQKLIEQGLEAEYVPGLFAGSDVFTGERYRSAIKLKIGLLWDRRTLASVAPIGVRGTDRFIKFVSAQTGIALRKGYAADYARALRQLEAAAAQTRGRVAAVEGAGWYAYALADFLKNDLGMRVLLSVDRAAIDIPWQSVCDEFYEDTGRFELVELMKAFGAQWVFGSSNVQLDQCWKTIPFYQPVWRVVEPSAMLGFDAACALAARIAQGEDQ